MSHRKVHSQGNVPFSWEDSPGVCKASFQDYHANSPPPFPPHYCSARPKVTACDSGIPLPPCLARLERSTSRKMLSKLEDLNLPPPPFPPHYYSARPKVTVGEFRIPLPPCLTQQERSSSRKMLSKPEDPFLAALKKCTKSVGSGKGGMKGRGSEDWYLFMVKKFKFGLSCKHSSEVKDDQLVRLGNFPPLPTRSRSANMKS
ncbi:hypothetical protein NMG60_11006009 [Bertholletia excelsa]